MLSCTTHSGDPIIITAKFKWFRPILLRLPQSLIARLCGKTPRCQSILITQSYNNNNKTIMRQKGKDKNRRSDEKVFQAFHLAHPYHQCRQTNGRIKGTRQSNFISKKVIEHCYVFSIKCVTYAEFPILQESQSDGHTNERREG